MMSHFRETFGRLNFMYRLYRVLQMTMCLRLNYISVTKKTLVSEAVQFQILW